LAKLTNKLKERIIADWKTGHYSQNKLAKNYHLSPATINKLCKYIEQDNCELVNSQTRINSELATKSKYEIESIDKAVDEKTKHLLLINSLTIKNLSKMGDKIGDGTTILEHKAVQETIDKGAITLGVAQRHAKNNHLLDNSEVQERVVFTGFSPMPME
jgi:hypothetical protein